MKESVSLVLTMVIPFIIFSSCNPKIDIENEKEAIKTLINNETQAALQKDTAKISQFYIHDDSQTRVSASCDTFFLFRGWDEISTLIVDYDMSGFTNIKFSKDFYQIKVIGDAAWAIYKDTWTFNQNDTATNMNILLMMSLEKKNNEWKISGLSEYILNN
jgi:hypothetical protein